MPFESISFSELFHEGFRLEGHALVLEAMLRNEIRRHVESALLADLLERHAGPLPEVTVEEAEALFDRQRDQLDYLEEQQTRGMLEQLGISVEALEGQLKRHLAVEKRVDEEIARLREDPDRQRAVLWQMFMDLSLRGRAIRASSAQVLSRYAEAPADPASVDKVRAHLVLLHEAATWSEVEQKLSRWGMPKEALDELVEAHARALTVPR